MPYCVEYFRGEDCVQVHCGGELPVLLSGGRVTFIRWGSRECEYALGDKAPGRFVRYPEGYHVPLAFARGDVFWVTCDRRPVKIAVSRFHVTWPFSDGPPTFRTLDPWVDVILGQFLQGALITPKIGDPRVYIVTVPPPEQYADIASPWPRIVPERKR